MKINLPPAPAADKLAALEKLRGKFHNGHTGDDVASVLGDVYELTGVHLVVIWAFNDCWGLGGDSELHFMDDAGRLREGPDGWWEFLAEPESDIAVASLFGVPSGNVIEHWERIHSWADDEYNFYRREIDGEAD